MDAFTFLKYWRSAGGEPPLPPPPAAPQTIHHDEGPFIDLEFMLPEDDDDDDDGHISFTLSPSTNNHSNMDPSPPPPPPPPPFAASFLKSATKFRVFMLGLKKPKPNSTQEGKLCTVKFKVEQVPILSLLTRDNTSKPRASSDNKPESLKHTHSLSSPSSSSEEKRSMTKYLRMVKPLSLYIRVSRSRYNEKLNQGEEAEGSKHLGKSRSASAAVLVSSGRRDDSLLQQHDGIQGAILHCKSYLISSPPPSNPKSPLTESSPTPSRQKQQEKAQKKKEKEEEEVAAARFNSDESRKRKGGGSVARREKTPSYCGDIGARSPSLAG
ncbi:hypothetical protein PIB30_062269 [Stylosanthes scabra]|uniref:Membrane-associated kinase regulator 2 n=1 Tax=Stylosanthes scabra TaxID=79078 RepID=A0ABU6QLK3_9FABA|nr:hypothetical protein [Stylosanthes scabra]